MSIENDIQNLTSAIERLAAAVEGRDHQNLEVVVPTAEEIEKAVKKAGEKPAGKATPAKPAKVAEAETTQETGVPVGQAKPTLLQVKAALVAKLGELRETKGHDYALAAVTKLRDAYTGGKPLAEEHSSRFAEVLNATKELA